MHEFCRVKTEQLRISKIPNHPPIMRAAKSVGGIEQKLQSVVMRNLRQRSDITRSSPQMDTDNSGCMVGYQFLYARRIDVVGHRIYVAKDRRYLLPFKGMSCSDKSKRRKNHLTGKPNGSCQNFETYRGVADSDAMLHAE